MTFAAALLLAATGAAVENTVHPGSDLTAAELDSVIAPKQPAAPLRRGRTLLSCLEDLYRNGSQAKGLPTRHRERLESRRFSEAAHESQLLWAINRVASERAREIARKALVREPVDERAITYAHVLLPDEKYKMLPLLVRAYKWREMRPRKAEIASLIGAYHEPSYLLLLAASVGWTPAEARRVAVAVMELRGDVAGLRAEVDSRGLGAGPALSALWRLGRADVVRGVAAARNNSLSAIARAVVAREAERDETAPRPVRDCGELNWMELDAALPILDPSPQPICGTDVRQYPNALLRRGRQLLPCLEDLYRNGARAKRLPREYRPRAAKLSHADQTRVLSPVLAEIAPDRMRAIAKREIESAPLNTTDTLSLITYAHRLLPEERDFVMERLVAAYKANLDDIYSHTYLASLASMIGSLHDPKQIPLLRNSLPHFKNTQDRAIVEVAILELEGDAGSLYRRVLEPKRGGGYGGIYALERLRRFDLLRQIATKSSSAPVRALARECLVGKPR